MDESPTFQALQAFIAAQNTLLARTREDLERLKHLRDGADEFTAQEVLHEASTAVVPLHHIADSAATPFDGIDWADFASRDVSALRQLSTTTREHRALRTEPSLKQTSPLSPFQLLVRGARKSILDPVFYALDLSFDPPPPTPLTPDAAAAKKALERAKIMDLKNRRLAGGGSSLTIRRSGDEGVYVRRDLADESEVVDVDMAAADPLPDVKPFDHGRAVDDTRDGHSASARKEPSAKSSRKRHALRDESYETASAKKKKTVKASKATRPTADPPAEASSAPVTSTSGRKARVKPETYKLAWSVEEQHLLEQLLERFPEGSKNRWLQISQAMNGRRTPRQVASRVQKYFEKLKQFGLEAEGAGAGNAEDEGDND